MADHKSHVKDHYNRHANKHATTREALRQRKEGVAAPLKQLHNEIKRQLIYRFGYQAESLLDYACGRGGDIHKWKAAQIKYVKGIDLSPQEIAEAKKRFAEVQREEPDLQLQAEFFQNDHLGDQIQEEEQKYDVVTCMFAIHYFFENKEMLSTFMDNVAVNLKEGGYFIGTCPDGKRIKAHLNKTKDGVFDSPCLKIIKQYEEREPAPFGSGVIIEIKDTVVEGHDGVSEGSTEYLVFSSTLKGVAAAKGLHPVVDYQDGISDGFFEEADKELYTKHFKPEFPEGTDPSLALASKLNMAFVFQKVSSPKDVHAPPQRPPPRRNIRVQRNRAGGSSSYQQQQHTPPPQQQQFPGPPPGQYNEPYYDQGPPGGGFYNEQPGPGGWNQMQQHYPAAGPPVGGPGNFGPGGYGAGAMEQHNGGGWPPGPPQGGYAPVPGYGPSGTAPQSGLPSAFWLSRHPEGRPGRWVLHDWFPQDITFGARHQDPDYGEQQEQEKRKQLEQLDMKRQKAALKRLKHGDAPAAAGAEEGNKREPTRAAAAAGTGDGGFGGARGSVQPAQLNRGRGSSDADGRQNMQGQQLGRSNGQRVAAGGSSMDPMGYGEGKDAVSYRLGEREGPGGKYPTYVHQ